VFLDLERGRTNVPDQAMRVKRKQEKTETTFASIDMRGKTFGNCRGAGKYKPTIELTRGTGEKFCYLWGLRKPDWRACAEGGSRRKGKADRARNPRVDEDSSVRTKGGGRSGNRQGFARWVSDSRFGKE